MKPAAALLLVPMMFLPAIACAHVGDHGLSHWSAGLLHPLTGLDHFLALVAGGVWLGQQPRGHQRALALVFISLLVSGIAAGLSFRGASFEPGIMATLIVLGGLVASSARLPLWIAMLILCAVAAIHGFTHGAEMTYHSGDALNFGLGLLISSALLLMLSAALTRYAQSRASTMSTKVVGLAVFLWGLVLAFSLS